MNLDSGVLKQKGAGGEKCWVCPGFWDFKVNLNYVFSLFSEDLEAVIYLKRKRGGGIHNSAFSGTKAWPYWIGKAATEFSEVSGGDQE